MESTPTAVRGLTRRVCRGVVLFSYHGEFEGLPSWKIYENLMLRQKPHVETEAVCSFSLHDIVIKKYDMIV